MRISILFSFSFVLLFSGQAQPYLNNETYTYAELISVYEELDEQHESAKLVDIGPSDIGKPIHLFILAGNGEFTAPEAFQSGKTIVFINNGIHPGEACGIDASVELAKQLLNPEELGSLLDSVIVLIVPVYNVGGMLNRGAYSRANQNGPKEHGFRGNAKNLDLNRDFVKMDSKNALTFNNAFWQWDPDLFVDTHTTNGSDHQYTLTLIATQKDKLNPILADYMHSQMLPAFYDQMKKREKEMIPYVYLMNQQPDEGIKAFLETPRYSSGYAALNDCFAFITEAHVFKEFKARVEHTNEFLGVLCGYAANNRAAIKAIRRKAVDGTINQQSFALAWELDTSKKEELLFKGYAQKTEISEVTQQQMRFYDQSKANDKTIPYYQSFQATVEVEKPDYYVIPQAYTDVFTKLAMSGVKFGTLPKDSIMAVNTYYIKSYETVRNPYEGHYLHFNVEVEQKLEEIQFYAGDYLVPTEQKAVRYLISALEPQSVDSYFAWNFFDHILQQKEWFSGYAFEPKAKQLLAENPLLKKEFELKRKSDPAFAKDNFQQLYFIYKRSPYYEKTVNRYPIYRVD